MSDKNKNVATELVATLQTDYDVKLGILNGLATTATPEQKTEAQTAVDSAKEALETAIKNAVVPVGKKGEKEKLIKGKFLISPTGRFGLAYNVGEEASLPELQANELEEAGYFKFNK